MSKSTGALPSISARALNRAMLARQGLLARQPVSAEAMLKHLIGLQGQVHNAPYVALWSRLEQFAVSDLEALLTSRRAVRATLMRVTLHVALAEDYLAIRPLLDSTTLRLFKSNHLKPLKGADLDEVRAASRMLLDRETLSPVALGRQLATRWPEAKPIDLSMPARFLEPIVHVPPAGLFGATHPPELTSARRWLGKRKAAPMPMETLMRRYLAAFGPATGNDFNTWSGLSGGARVLDAMRPELVSFRGPDGRELFDLPEAPRPEEATEAPVRLLPDYDNVLLGYADRSRILPAGAWQGLWRANGLRPAFTVDGMVRGSWKLTLGKSGARIALSPFARLRRREEAALQREAEALLGTVAPGQKVAVDFAAAPVAKRKDPARGDGRGLRVIRRNG